jgi:polyisoprenoid-binding protein YceI
MRRNTPRIAPSIDGSCGMRTPTPRSRPRPGTIIAALLLALAGVLAPLPAFAAAADYELDPVHTRVMFAISHAGFSQALGTVSGSTGRLHFDPDDWRGARIEVQVPLAKLDLGDAEWNEATAKLVDAGKYPLATFVSTRVEPVDATHASVFGMLTVHGISQEIRLDVVLNAVKRDPMPPFKRRAGFSATATISRKAFGISAWPSVIGDSVELRIEAEASHTRRGTEDKDEAPAPGDDDATTQSTPAADATP